MKCLAGPVYESVNGKREARGNLSNRWLGKEGFAIARLQNI